MPGEPTAISQSQNTNHSMDAPFTQEQIQVLRNASDSAYYKVEKLWRRLSNGRTQYCVLIGESHVKPTESARQLGEAIARSFQRFGIEAADPSLTWGSSLMKSGGQLMSILGHFAPDISTIDAILDTRGQSISNYPDILEEVAEEYALKTMSPQEQERVNIQLRVDEDGHLQLPENDQKNRRWPIIKVPSLTAERIKIFTGTYNGREIMAALDPIHFKGTEIFLLEYHHQPNFTENIASILVPIALISGATALVSGALIPYNPPVAGTVLAVSSRIFIPIALVTFAGFLIDRFLVPEEYRELKILVNPIIGGFIYARNETMASNIDRIDDERPLIAIMGAAHVADISYLLRTKFKFQ